MNIIKKNLTYIVAFLLALGFASLANAEANNTSDLADGSSVAQSLDLNQQQTDVQQSVLPSCGSYSMSKISQDDGGNTSNHLAFSARTMFSQIVPSDLPSCSNCCNGVVHTCCEDCD